MSKKGMNFNRANEKIEIMSDPRNLNLNSNDIDQSIADVILQQQNFNSILNDVVNSTGDNNQQFIPTIDDY
jgi:hypothetical protein